MPNTHVLTKKEKERILGFLISAIFHILIFLIPISLYINQRIENKEIEIYFNDNTIQKTEENPKREIKKTTKTLEKIIEPAVVNETTETQLPVKVIEKPEKLENTEKTVANEKEKIYDVDFGTATGPKFLHREMPVYPLMARKFGREGRVLLRLTIDEKGGLENVEVVESACCGFTESAIEAVKKSTYLPAVINGKPQRVKALLSIRFNLKKD